jgi:hypothetical protein
MKIKTLFMIICLLLVAPFIGGDDTPPIGSDTAGGETEIPAAHSMYRAQGAYRGKGRRTATPATTPTDTAFIRRQKRLFTKEDIISNPPEATLNKSTGRINSRLPRSPPNGMCSNMGPLAHSARTMLKTCEPSLSKRQVSKLIKPLFPSRSRLKRDMKRAELKGESGAKVRDSYYFCQQALYATLQAWTFAGPAAEQEALENKLSAERKVLNKTLQNLGGYKSLTDKRQTHRLLPQYLNRPSLIKIDDSGVKLEKVQTLCRDHNIVDKTVAGHLGVLLNQTPDIFLGMNVKKFLKNMNRSYKEYIEPIQAEIKNRNEAEAEAWSTCDLVVNHEADKSTILFRRIENLDFILSNIEDDSVTIPTTGAWNPLDAYDVVEPWKDYPTAKALVETQYIEALLPLAQSSSWAFLAHPEIANVSTPSAEGLRNALGSAHFQEGEPAVEIPRKTFTTVKEMMKQSFESIVGLNKNAGLSIISNTKDDNNRSLNKEELVTQWLDSTIILETPNGVERELGVYWNNFYNEGDWYNNRYEGELYSFTAPTKEAAEKAEVQSLMDKLLAQIG